MRIVQEKTPDGLAIKACGQCGTPLLSSEGLGAFIAGTRELFCRGSCIGQRREQQNVVVR